MRGAREECKKSARRKWKWEELINIRGAREWEDHEHDRIVSGTRERGEHNRNTQVEEHEIDECERSARRQHTASYELREECNRSTSTRGAKEDHGRITRGAWARVDHKGSTNTRGVWEEYKHGRSTGTKNVCTRGAQPTGVWSLSWLTSDDPILSKWTKDITQYPTQSPKECVLVPIQRTWRQCNRYDSLKYKMVSLVKMRNYREELKVDYDHSHIPHPIKTKLDMINRNRWNRSIIQRLLVIRNCKIIYMSSYDLCIPVHKIREGLRTFYQQY